MKRTTVLLPQVDKEGQEGGCSFQRQSRWDLASKASPLEGVGPTAGWDTQGKRNKVTTLLGVRSQFGCPAFILITKVTKLSKLINLEMYLESVGQVAQSLYRLSYRLDGPGSDPGGDEIFRPSRPALGPTQPPVKWVPGLSWG